MDSLGAAHAGIMEVGWDPRLVVLSCVISVFASYVALDLARTVTSAGKGWARGAWLLFGAVAMGLGIWSMHFTGMLAFHPSTPPSYDVPLVAVSALVAVAASALALFVVSRRRMTVRILLAGGPLMGAGIVGMHYTGMAAVRMPATISYDPTLVALSGFVAVGASISALWMAFTLRGNRAANRNANHRNANRTGRALWLKLGAAVVMGVAIAGMHYTGMAAASFTPTGGGTVDASPTEPLSLGLGIGAATILILTLALAGSVVSGRLAVKTRELEEYEQHYGSLFLHNPDAVYSADRRGFITAVNPAAERLTGYRASELLGTNAGDLVVHEDREKAADYFGMAARGDGRSYELAITNKAGERLELGVTSLPTVVGGRIRGVYSVVKDVSERKRAEEDLRRRNDYLASLQETAMDFMNRLGTDRMLSSIISRAADLVGARNGYAFLVEPGAEEMGVRAAIGVYADRSGGHTMRRGQGLGGRVWESGEPLVVNGHEDRGGRGPGTTAAAGSDRDPEGRPSAAVAVPIKSVGEVVGVLALAHDEEHGGSFGPEEVGVLQSFADLAAVALHNARLHDAVEGELAERRRAELEVRELSRYNRNLFDVNLDALVALNPDGRIKDANPAMGDLVGLSKKALMKRSFASLVVDPAGLEEALRLVLEQGYLRDYPMEVRRERPKNASPAPVLLNATVFRDADGEVAGVLASARDMTERVRTEKALKESEDRYRSILEALEDGYFEVDLDGNLTFFNDSVCKILGYGRDELMGLGYHEYMDPTNTKKVSETFDEIYRTGRPEKALEYEVIRRDGTRRYVETPVDLLRDRQGNPAGFRGLIRDVSERKDLERRLAHQAFHDSLTGLPNRALFIDRLGHALARAGREGGSVAVLFMDLDNFKVVNDSLGHEAGDRLLVEAAERLSTCVRPGDTAARLGGDEFAVIVESVTEPGAAARIAERVAERLSEPFDVSGRRVFVSASIGIAVGEAGDGDSEDLIRRADLAMYGAKKKGKAGYEVFDPSMNAVAHDRLALENDLRGAVERGDFRLYYQPKVRIDACSEGAGAYIVGVEALIRWEHPERGLVSPAVFIPIAEETGLIVPIGRWVLSEACRCAKAWQQDAPLENGSSGRPQLMMSVNLSARQFGDENLVRDVAAVLEETGLAPESLILEITESVVMDDAPKTVDVLRELKSLGVLLSIDDFGTGYSSLSYLKRFPVDYLKVDRSFVGNIAAEGEASEDAVIVGGIVSLAQDLGLTVVAEGVETVGQLRRLREMDCDLAQGYYFSKPLPATAMDELLAAGRGGGPLGHAASRVGGTP